MIKRKNMVLNDDIRPIFVCKKLQWYTDKHTCWILLTEISSFYEYINSNYLKIASNGYHMHYRIIVIDRNQQQTDYCQQISPVS